MDSNNKSGRSRNNPIEKLVHNVPIRRDNRIQLCYNARDYEKIINGAFEAGTSLSAYINMHLQPCSHCHAESIIIPRVRVTPKIQKDDRKSIFERNKHKDGQ